MYILQECNKYPANGDKPLTISIAIPIICPAQAEVVELVDTSVSKTDAFWACEFDSRLRHQNKIKGLRFWRGPFYFFKLPFGSNFGTPAPAYLITPACFLYTPLYKIYILRTKQTYRSTSA